MQGDRFQVWRSLNHKRKTLTGDDEINLSHSSKHSRICYIPEDSSRHWAFWIHYRNLSSPFTKLVSQRLKTNRKLSFRKTSLQRESIKKKKILNKWKSKFITCSNNPRNLYTYTKRIQWGWGNISALMPGTDEISSEVLLSIPIIHFCKGLIKLRVSADRALEIIRRLENLKELSDFSSCTNRSIHNNDFCKSDGICKLF